MKSQEGVSAPADGPSADEVDGAATPESGFDTATGLSSRAPQYQSIPALVLTGAIPGASNSARRRHGWPLGRIFGEQRGTQFTERGRQFEMWGSWVGKIYNKLRDRVAVLVGAKLATVP